VRRALFTNQANEIAEMAQHKSAKKRIRRNSGANVVNHGRLSRIRTAVRALESAIAAGDKAAAQAAFKKVTPELMRGATKGVLRKQTVARKLSRLSARIKSLAA
jgi:small subunit ribosomal protein S20